VDQRQSGAHPAFEDAEWVSRVQRAASADVWRLLRQARRRQRERWLVTAMVLVAIGLVLVLLFRVDMFGSDPPAAPSGALPTTPVAAALPAFDLNRPFAKTPAADWADGPAGIVVPEPKAVKGFSAEQVAAATKHVRDILIASRLNPRMTVEHDPTPFLDLLAADAQRQLRPLFGTGREAEAQALVSLIAKDATLLPVAPKVNGTMSVRAGNAGELIVHTNYVFVYAFDPPRPADVVDVMDAIVVVRAEVDYKLLTGPRWTPGSQGWWYGDTGGYGYSIACATYRKGYLAPAFSENVNTDVRPRQDRTAYFDPTSPLPAAGGCPR
jgi:hypothetical protein